MTRLTASEMERAAKCPASVTLPRQDGYTEAAVRGTDIHAFLERIPAMGREASLELVPADWREVCEAIDVERLPTNLAAEVALAYDVRTDTGRELGRGLRRDYSAAAPSEIVGTSDVIGLADDAVLVSDWKTGRSDTEPAARSPQIRTLSLAAARAYGRDIVHAEKIRIRENGAAWRDRAVFDVFDLDEIADEVRTVHAAVTAPEPAVRPGPWCRHCPAFASCPAQTALLRRVVDGSEIEDVERMLPLSPEVARVAYERWQAMKHLMKRIEAALHAYAKEHPIPLGGHRVFGELITEGNEQLDGDVAYAVMRDMFGQDVADAAVKRTATKTGIREALRPTLDEPRKLATTERRVHEAIRQRGGAHRPMTSKVTEYEAPPSENQEATEYKQ
jgi:hypothetical protein